MKSLDDPFVNALTLEKIVCSDPGLSASLLRVASSALYAADPVETLKAAIFRIGFDGIRSMAMALCVSSVVKKSRVCYSFDSQLFVRHSLFVALASQVIASEAKDRSEINPDEAFTMGMLHDLPAAIMSQIATEEYEVVTSFARKNKVGFGTAFEKTYSQPISWVGEALVERWSLPHSLIHAFDVETAEFEDPLLICVQKAHSAAIAHDFRLENWILEFENPPEKLEGELNNKISNSMKQILAA